MVSPSIIAAGIGAVGNLAGSFLGNASAAKNNKNAFRLAQRQAVFQETMARHGIQWRVNDAKEAGIHPLYALGANLPTYSPVSANFTAQDWSGLGRAGQDISRGINAALDREERAKAQATNEEYRRVLIENEKKKGNLYDAQAAALLSNARVANQPGNPPPAPRMAPEEPMVASTPTKRVLSEETVVSPNKPAREPGINPDYTYINTPSGLAVVPSKVAKERFEDDILGSLSWNLRNRLLPMLGDRSNVPNIKLPKGFKWHYNFVKQQWQPHKKVYGVYIPWKLPRKFWNAKVKGK